MHPGEEQNRTQLPTAIPCIHKKERESWTDETGCSGVVEDRKGHNNKGIARSDMDEEEMQQQKLWHFNLKMEFYFNKRKTQVNK